MYVRLYIQIKMIQVLWTGVDDMIGKKVKSVQLFNISNTRQFHLVMPMHMHISHMHALSWLLSYIVPELEKRKLHLMFCPIIV